MQSLLIILRKYTPSNYFLSRVTMSAVKRNSSASSPAAKKARNTVIDDALAAKCINTIRVLAADTVEKANSGHPGAPMGCAPIAHILWTEFMKYNGENPKWTNRDRFVLSNGHACALQYCMLHLAGYKVTLDDLKSFRQVDSITPGHPENFATPGIEVSTGPLGQGIANAVGLAIAEAHLAATFNQAGHTIVDHYTYVLCGDGCLQEGVSGEASSLAGHLGLGKLIVLYDDNNITIDGETELSFSENVVMRYDSYGWHTQTVTDVNDANALRAAINNAKQETNRPSLIKVRTVIGHGSLKAGSEKVHGAPLGKDDIAHVKTQFGFDPNATFVVPDDVAAVYADRAAHGRDTEAAWDAAFKAYAAAHSELAEEFTRRMEGRLPANWKDKIPVISGEEPKALATRQHSEKVLNAVAEALPELVGGSADLTPSNLTALKCSGDFQHATPAGRYLRFGVREHAMAAICNGICAHGGLRPFAATFLNFMGYAMGASRLSALSRFGVIYIMTHDSIGLGEDGPTHQPVEMLEQLRAMPNMLVFRPADGNETAGSYISAVEHAHTPSVLALSRQAAPAIPSSAPEKVARGAYVCLELGTVGKPEIVLASSGTEVHLAVQVAKALHAKGVSVRVVSMPCWELFDAQSLDYQLDVFPKDVPVMSIEASGSHGWEKYAHAVYGLHTFGSSGPGAKVYAKFGFTVDNLTKCAEDVLTFYSDKPATSLLLRPKFTHAAPAH